MMQTQIFARPLIGMVGVLGVILGAGPAAAADPPLGLWAFRTAFHAGAAGELELTHQGKRWRGRLGNARAVGLQNGRDVRLIFPTAQGSFRGTFEKGDLRGFWIRRAMTEDPRYPLGEALAYAGPLRLKGAGPNRWRAVVRPLPDTFTLYLKIFRDSDGSVKAAFRNPEQNSHGSAMQFAVQQSGNELQFTPIVRPGAPAAPMKATLLTAGRVSIFWPDLQRALVLERTESRAAENFFPGRQGSAPYTYRQPSPEHDGWTVARGRDVGLDESALEGIVQRIRDTDPAARRPLLVHSLAIAYRGKLVLDEYFYGHRREMPHDTRSASKTFSSVILGALMHQGVGISPAARIYPLMARRGPFSNPDPRKAEITLGHLLTHSAGFACDDNADSSPGSEDAIEADRRHPDWTKVTLDLPMQYTPGAHYAYCSMNINLAGAVLSEATGEWLPALFDRTVARPLQFGPYYWNLAGNGDGYLGGGVFVRPRDFLKVGQAYLNGGVWNGRRIASSDWVKEAFAPHAHISPETTGRSGTDFTEFYREEDEGWAWHMAEIKTGKYSIPVLHANGNGGQLLLLVPQLDLAIMFTAGEYQSGLWNVERDRIVGDMLLPSLLRTPADWEAAQAGRRPASLLQP